MTADTASSGDDWAGGVGRGGERERVAQAIKVVEKPAFLYMYVLCMYVCMYVCMCVCVCVYVCMCVYIYIYIYIYECTSLSIYIYVHT